MHMHESLKAQAHALARALTGHALTSHTHTHPSTHAGTQASTHAHAPPLWEPTTSRFVLAQKAAHMLMLSSQRRVLRGRKRL